MSMALYEATRKFQDRVVLCVQCGNGISTDEHIERCLFEADSLTPQAGRGVS